MSAAPPRRLYDPATRAVVRRDTQRAYAIALALTTVVVGALVFALHTDTPFLAYALDRCPDARFAAECEYEPILDWAAGLMGTIAWVLFAGTLFAFRRPAPTIFCATCDGMGWIADLERTAGACPRCGHDVFDHRTFTSLGEIQPLVVDWERLSGAELLRRREHDAAV